MAIFVRRRVLKTVKVVRYAPPLQVPVLLSVSPRTGTILGGTSVTLTGWNLTAALASSLLQPGFTVVNDTTITGVTLPGVVGVVSATVSNARYASAPLANAFIYVSIPPAAVITSSSPRYGSTQNTRAITILGNTINNPAVTIGGVACTVNGWTTGSINITAPSGLPAGQLPIVVTNSGGAPPTTDAQPYAALAMTFWGNVGLNATQVGGKISSMADQSGAGITGAFAQATSGTRPVFTANDFGAEPGATFAAANSTILASANTSDVFGSGPVAFSVFAIAKHTNPATDTFKTIVGKSFSAEYFDLCTDATATGKVQFTRSFSGGLAAMSNAACNDGVARAFVGTWDGTGAGTNNVVLYVNGTAQTTKGSDSGALGSNAAEPLTIGGAQSSVGVTANFITGDVAEWFGVASVLSTTVIAFLSNKNIVGTPANLAGVP